MKKLAIHLYGHMRTFERTYETFFKHIIEPNKEDYEIDIFIHTWDTLCVTPQKGWWHENLNYFNDLIDKPTNLEQIKTIYNPALIKIEKLNEGEYGMRRSMQSVHSLRSEYEALNGKYDIYLTTRPDIYFDSPLKINYFLELYNGRELSHVGLPEKFCFAAGKPWRLWVLDSRFPNEGDLLWFDNTGFANECQDKFAKVIFIPYRLEYEFEIMRETSTNEYIEHFKKRPKGINNFTPYIDKLLQANALYEQKTYEEMLNSPWILAKRIRKLLSAKIRNKPKPKIV